MKPALRFPAFDARRARALLLAFALEALVILLFLFLVPDLPGKLRRNPTTFSFDVGEDQAAESKTETRQEKRSGGGKSGEAPVRAAPVPPSPAPPVPSADILWLPRTDYQALNTAMRSPTPARSASDAGAAGDRGNGRDDSTLAAGRAPNGEPLYAAEWYVRPTNAQLTPYRPTRYKDGWGVIACRTIENYRVDDCQEIAESPRGSGFAHAVFNSAWQFRVRPPSKGGKSLVGAWVSIRIDYTTHTIGEADRKPAPEPDEER